jgi:hypothetical protein
MTGSPAIVPASPSGARLARYLGSRLVLSGVSVAAAVAAMLVLATQTSDEMLDYGVGVVPALVPWLSACLSVVVVAVGWDERRDTSTAMSALIGALIIVTAWAITMLPFDVLRMVRLVPLPLSGWGIALRLLLLVAATAALVPVLGLRRARLERCSACRRAIPGALDRMPRWPAVVAVIFALPYPVLRVHWALGGTFGTVGTPLDLDPAVAWGVVIVGATLEAFALLLLIGKGPRWARALFGLGGVVAGAALTVNGGLAAAVALSAIATEGLESSPGADLTASTFLLVYGSWFVAGLGIMAASWRYWAHRRDDCPVCRTLLGP